MSKDTFYEMVKNKLPCCVDDWTDEQLKTQYKITQQAVFDSNVKNAKSYLLEMIQNVANRRGLQL